MFSYYKNLNNAGSKIERKSFLLLRRDSSHLNTKKKHILKLLYNSSYNKIFWCEERILLKMKKGASSNYAGSILVNWDVWLFLSWKY